MSAEQMSYSRESVVMDQSESDWTLVEVNGQLHIDHPGREQLDVFAPRLERREAILSEIDAIERKMQHGEASEALALEHYVLTVELEWLTGFCVDAGLIPETI